VRLHLAQSAFAQKLGLSSEQLSEFEPKGATCAAFGVLHEGGFPQRALVVIDPEGVVGWSHQAPSPGDLPGVELLREGLSAALADA
jgi:peroxiredoxin (alkyl hydroperoxide reductase subunit C)